VDASRQPVLVAVDDDPEALGRTGAELRRRYGDDYRVVCQSSSEAALAELEALRAQGEAVALVLADVWMAEGPGSDVLNRVRSLHPHAKRALLIDWGAWGHRPTADSILHAMATGRIDYYVLKPVRSRDEQFHRMISEFLHEWSRAHSADAFELAVVADPGSPRTHELRDLLRRSGVPHGFHEADSAEGRALCEDADIEPGAPPLVRMRNGRILRDPSNEEVVAAFGVDTELEGDSNFDLIIVGAGPAGLSAAVYASSEGLRTLVIERETIGGQAGSSSLIRNYLGFSRGVAGAELAQRAYQQAWVFGTRFAISREVRSLQLDRMPYEVGCDGGYFATGRAVLLATGVSYRRIGIPAVDELTGAGVYYGASTVEGLGLGSEDAYVVGGGNSGGQAALHLARTAARVRLVARGAALTEDMSQYLCATISATPNIEVLAETEVVDGGGQGRLEWLELRDNRTNDTRRVPAAAVFILIGARPRTDWLPDAIARDDRGHVLTGADVLAGEAAELWPLDRAPATYETSVPGVFAVGDTRHGAVKRVASAVGEGSVAIPDVHEWLAASAQPAVR
jgi:thioredoxin reductase (NADPH)